MKPIKSALSAFNLNVLKHIYSHYFVLIDGVRTFCFQEIVKCFWKVSLKGDQWCSNVDF